MLILAIDPGPMESHWVMYDSESRVVVGSGSDANWAVRRRLLEVEDGLYWEGLEVCPGRVVIENMEPRGQRLGHDVVDTILWIGRFQEASGGELLGRSKVWKHLCGKDRDDAAVRAVLIDKLGPKLIPRKVVGPKGGVRVVNDPGPTHGVSKHQWQALGLAVTYAETADKETK